MFLYCVIISKDIKEYEVWTEGYALSGGSSDASFLGVKKANSFKEACVKAIKDEGFEMIYYNDEDNTYWGCSFFDNEIEARISFG